MKVEITYHILSLSPQDLRNDRNIKPNAKAATPPKTIATVFPVLLSPPLPLSMYMHADQIIDINKSKICYKNKTNPLYQAMLERIIGIN